MRKLNDWCFSTWRERFSTETVVEITFSILPVCPQQFGCTACSLPAPPILPNEARLSALAFSFLFFLYSDLLNKNQNIIRRPAPGVQIFLPPPCSSSVGGYHCLELSSTVRVWLPACRHSQAFVISPPKSNYPVCESGLPRFSIIACARLLSNSLTGQSNACSRWYLIFTRIPCGQGENHLALMALIYPSLATPCAASP